MPSFENFFDDDSIGSYLRNPFGEDFIKLEIDQKSFRTNKTKVSTAEYLPSNPLSLKLSSYFHNFQSPLSPFHQEYYSQPGVHHIPLDVHGFPDVPSLRTEVFLILC